MKQFSLFISSLLVLFTVHCYSVGWRCVNECPSNVGEYTSSIDDKYIGPTEESPFYKKDPYVKTSFFPIGKGKLIYGQETPGSKRGFINTGDEYEGEFGWDEYGHTSGFSGEGTYRTALGTITKTTWENGRVKKGAPVEKRFANGLLVTGSFDSGEDVCVGNCTNGKGIRTFGKNDFFAIGNFKNGYLEGSGSFFNGTTFQRGNFSEGVLTEGNLYCVSDLEHLCEYNLPFSDNPNVKYKGWLKPDKLPKN